MQRNTPPEEIYIYTTPGYIVSIMYDCCQLLLAEECLLPVTESVAASCLSQQALSELELTSKQPKTVADLLLAPKLLVCNRICPKQYSDVQVCECELHTRTAASYILSLHPPGGRQ